MIVNIGREKKTQDLNESVLKREKERMSDIYHISYEKQTKK